MKTTRYEIRDPDGKLIAVHVRKDRPGKEKLVWWEQPDGKRGLNGMEVTALPLYGIHSLAAANCAPAAVTEGEKAKDACEKHGFCAVGTVTGAATTPSDDTLRPLLAHPVLLWPDNDPPGREHMRRIAATLQRLGHQDVRVVEWPEAPEKGDAADFFERGGTAEGARLLFEKAKPVEAPPPKENGNGTGTEKNILDHFEKVEKSGTEKWAALCPAHEDNKPSLSIRRAEDGKWLLKCHTGCATADVVRAAGLTWNDLFPATSGSRLILDPKAPMTFARSFIEHRYTQNGARTLILHGGQLLGWSGGAYTEIEDGALNAAGYGFLEGAFHQTIKGLMPFQPNKASVSELFSAVEAQVYLSNNIVPPVWLNGEGPVPAGELLGVQNGLLHLPSGRMFPHSPHFFTRNVLPVAFVPDAGKSPEWNRFLRDLFETNEELRNTLQEMFGYFLTPDTRQQKIFMLVGPKRAGKGVIGRVITALLGRDNVCGPTLASLGTNFGLSTLVGKQLAIISDARLGSRADQHLLAERLLSISGEDGIDIDRKYRDHLAGVRLSTRFLFLTNELPRIADTSGALASRFILVPLVESFYDREDHDLLSKLLEELPVILNWSIEGWKRLKKRGRFVQPTAAEVLVQELEDLGSPVTAFLRECCVTGPRYRVRHQHLFKAWCDWNSQQGQVYSGSSQLFGRDLRAALPGLKVERPRVTGGKQLRVYVGLRLRG